MQYNPRLYSVFYRLKDLLNVGDITINNNNVTDIADITFYLDIDESNWNLSKALNERSHSGLNRPTLLSFTSMTVLPGLQFSHFLNEDMKNEIHLILFTLYY